MDEQKSKYIGINPNDFTKRLGFLEAAEAGRLETVKKQLRQGCDINQINTARKTALILAATEGEFEVVKLLCEHGADIHYRAAGWTAQKYAAYHGHREIADYLDKVSDKQARYHPV